MNYVIVNTVRSSRKMFGANDTNTGMETRQRTMKSAENQLTIMLILVTTLFLILLCPTYFRFIYLVFAKRDTPIEYAKSMLIYQITSKLYTTNSGVNFLLYCISGKKFRNDLKEILVCSSITDGSSSGSVRTILSANWIHLIIYHYPAMFNFSFLIRFKSAYWLNWGGQSWDRMEGSKILSAYHPDCMKSMVSILVT